jgi:hypothetical protein
MLTTFGQVDEVFNRVTSPDITADILNVSMLGILLPDMPMQMEPPIDCGHRVIEKLNELPDFTSDPDLEAEFKHRMQGLILSDKSSSSHQRNISAISEIKRQPKRPIAKNETDTKVSDSTLICDPVSTSHGKTKTKRSRVVIKPKQPCI